MPGFWTVFKWMLAITLAPIIVWVVITVVVLAVAIVNAEPPAKQAPAPRSVRHGAR